jgi:hypothetical protein
MLVMQYRSTHRFEVPNAHVPSTDMDKQIVVWVTSQLQEVDSDSTGP